MKALKSPNSWSCLPTAFAIALEVPLDAVLAILGHDGSEERFPSLDGPRSRRGFHLQELVRMCLDDGIAATLIEMLPAITPFDKPVPYGSEEGEIEWFFQNLRDSEGILESRNPTGNGHALAYSGHGDCIEVCDPHSGATFHIDDLTDLEKRGLFVFNLWRLDIIS